MKRSPVALAYCFFIAGCPAIAAEPQRAAIHDAGIMSVERIGTHANNASANDAPRGVQADRLSAVR